MLLLDSHRYHSHTRTHNIVPPVPGARCTVCLAASIHSGGKIGAQIEVAYGGGPRPFITNPVENVLLHIHGNGGCVEVWGWHYNKAVMPMGTDDEMVLSTHTEWTRTSTDATVLVATPPLLCTKTGFFFLLILCRTE